MAANRIRRVTVSKVLLWDREIGAVAWDDKHRIGSFQYTPDFVHRGPEIAPLKMPLREQVYSFPALNYDTYSGLPGLLADSLPDRYGKALVDIWLRKQGRDIKDFNPVERLCYMGSRGMGALEFKPAIGPQARKAIPIEISKLTQLATEILRHRAGFSVNLKGSQAEALKMIIRVGTSAGGARAKAVIAWNPKTGEVRSGQVAVPAGFEPWILKFDGANLDTLGEPKGYGRIEYAYHKMAMTAGIKMSNCHLLEEDGRAHFMTRRFDRTDAGEKVHMQSLCAMAHFDFNASGEYSYEHAFGVIQKLNLGHPAMQEMYRRMLFNVLARNQDDHTRNISFLMDKTGKWRLAPAYDVIWSYNPQGRWSDRHQMTINGKTDDFTGDDLLVVADQYGIKDAKGMLLKVDSAVSRWPEFAKQTGVAPEKIKEIGETHRLNIVGRRNY